MTVDQAIKIYNTLEVGLWEFGNLCDNTGASLEYGDEVRAFLKAGRVLQQKVETKFSKDGKAI